MNMQATVNEVEIRGITTNQLQDIYENALRDFKEAKTRVIFLDASYMYTFHLDDFENVRQFNILGRYYANHLRELNIKKRKHEYVNPVEYDIVYRDNSKYCMEWHRCLELWYDDRNVTLGDRTFRPIKISRTFDRVVNEGLEMMSGCMCGEGDAMFEFRAIGDGDVGNDIVSPAALALNHLVDMINVNETPEGGSLSRDGTTIYSVGNHSKEVETPVDSKFTQCSMHDDENQSKMNALDISNFMDPVPHTQNSDAPGSTTIIYMCSS